MRIVDFVGVLCDFLGDVLPQNSALKVASVAVGAIGASFNDGVGGISRGGLGCEGSSGGKSSGVGHVGISAGHPALVHLLGWVHR